jgi:hypothetical protein
MRMEQLLFADENAPKWAFHMRSGKRSKKEKRCKDINWLQNMLSYERIEILSMKMVNIYKNRIFIIPKSIFENRFWTFINVHFSIYLQSLGKSIFVGLRKTAYGVVRSKYQIFNFIFVTVIFW